LGVDVPALVNPGILTQMRLLYLLQRYMDGDHERHEAHVPIARRPGWPQLSTRDVLRAGTKNGLAAVGLGDRLGHIAPGHEADIVLLSAEPFGLAEGCLSAHIVMNTSHADIDSVIVAGEFKKKSGQLLGIDTKQALAERLRSRANVLERAGEIGAGPMRETWWPWVGAHP
jgi:cytosine/adenosine deaminase-related metal-dependent hydrolase